MIRLKPHEELIVWRRREGLSQKDLAERFGVTQGYISHMEKGLRPIPESVRGLMPRRLSFSEGDELYIRMKRVDMSMLEAVKYFNCSHEVLLEMIRDERDVSQYVWEKLMILEKTLAA